MAKSPIQKTIYKRSFIQLALAIFLIFLVFGLSYLLIFNRLSRQQIEIQTLKTAQAVAAEYARDMQSFEGAQNSSELIHLANFSARSSNSLIWLITAEGDVIYATAFPKQADQAFGQREGLPQLPPEFLNKSGYGQTYGEQFAPFLGPDRKWLSVSQPIESSLGNYLGEVLIHKHLAPEEAPGVHLLQTLLISLGIALFTATIAIFLLARNLTRPISALAKTAEAVYHGDLTARVSLPGKKTSFLLSREGEGQKPESEDDLTLLVKTMNSLIASLEEEEADRESFLASISHDLRTPLTSIKGFVTGLLDGTIPPADAERYLRLVEAETKRMQELVQSLFNASSVETRAHADFRDFDLNDLITRNIALFETEIKAKHLQLQYELYLQSADGHCLVHGDPQLIYRVISNLLSNAIRFTPESGRIRLSTTLSERAGLLRVRVEDTGPGVPENEREAIFERFYKVDKARSSTGSGLGLYIARSLLGAHGQNLSYFVSELGGAGFTFELPLSNR